MDRFALRGFRRQRRPGGGVGEAHLHFAQEAVERIDAAAIFAMVANSALLAAADWPAVSNAGPIGLATHQRRIFLAERARPMASSASAYPTTARITSPFSTGFRGLKSRQRSA